MKNINLVLKVEDQSFQHTSILNKIIGTVDVKNIAKLINAVGLKANPRKSKVCNTTDQIIDTLEFNPDKLRFCSKGILVSSSECHTLDRNRLNLRFVNENIEGVLDGGHNILACGLSILSMIGISDGARQKLKNWDQFYDLWKEVFKEESYKKIDEVIAETSKKPENIAKLPIEIIFPTEEGYSNFEQNVNYISSARNNNTSLSVTTVSDHKLYYDSLKQRLDPIINKKIAWKDNEETGHKKPIKPQDIIALSLIPLITLQKAGLLNKELQNINPVEIYSSKGKCVQIFNNLIELENPVDENGIKPTSEEINNNLESNELLMSAFEKMALIPHLEDYLYIKLPIIYNASKRRFGSCQAVKRYSTTEKGSNFIKKKELSQFYETESDYKYPKGFYTPIVVSLSALMHVKGERLEWRVQNPEKFLESNLDKILEEFFMVMDSLNSEPQAIGKSALGYRFIAKEIDNLLNKK